MTASFRILHNLSFTYHNFIRSCIILVIEEESLKYRPIYAKLSSYPGDRRREGIAPTYFDGGEWSASRPIYALPTGKELPVPTE
jgi:hypothetical protein